MMNTILQKLLTFMFRRRVPSLQAGDADPVLNFSLELAQEWGKDWLKPVQERLRKAYPQMPQAELDRLNTVAQAAMKFGHDLVYMLAEKHGRGGIDQDRWRAEVLARYPWIDERNLTHLFSTGKYYAWKDLG